MNGKLLNKPNIENILTISVRFIEFWASKPSFFLFSFFFFFFDMSTQERGRGD
jgi:hypothetical protein